MNSKMTFAATSILLAGVLAISYGCASSSDDGAGGSTGNSSSESSSGGDAGSSGSSSGGSGGGNSSSSSSGGGGSGNAITFEKGKATGLFSGYGWVTLGAQDTITDPTCKTETDEKAPITKADACTAQTNWKDGGDGKLCMTGKIPALDSAKPDYTGNWGVQIGVNAADPSDAVGSAMSGFKTVTFTFSGTPTSGLRGLFHRKGDDADKTTPFCMDSIKSGKAYELVKFNRECWGPTSSTEYLKEADLSQIDLVGLQVSSTTSGEITVTDLCLEKVEFGTSI